MSYYPEESFSVDLDKIVKRAQNLKTKITRRGAKNFVIFWNGTVIAIPSEGNGDPFVSAKDILNTCMSNHPDFNLIEEPYEDLTCTILLMSRGLVATYLFSDEWEEVKDKVQRDKMMCQSEVLLGWEEEPEEVLKKALYARLRIFADGKDPQLYKLI